MNAARCASLARFVGVLQACVHNLSASPRITQSHKNRNESVMILLNLLT